MSKIRITKTETLVVETNESFGTENALPQKEKPQFQWGKFLGAAASALALIKYVMTLYSMS